MLEILFTFYFLNLFFVSCMEFQWLCQKEFSIACLAVLGIIFVMHSPNCQRAIALKGAVSFFYASVWHKGNLHISVTSVLRSPTNIRACLFYIFVLVLLHKAENIQEKNTVLSLECMRQYYFQTFAIQSKEKVPKLGMIMWLAKPGEKIANVLTICYRDRPMQVTCCCK